ncbi:MAG: hypothetical protein ACRDJL_12525 [Actinomycetota bacterium]
MEGVLRHQEDAGRALALGPELVTAVAAADWEAVRSKLHPELHLRGLTPGKFNQANGPEAVAQAIDILKLWFYEDVDYLTEVLSCEARPMGPDGRYKLSYGFRAKSPGMSEWYADWDLDPPGPMPTGSSSKRGTTTSRTTGSPG